MSESQDRQIDTAYLRNDAYTSVETPGLLGPAAVSVEVPSALRTDNASVADADEALEKKAKTLMMTKQGSPVSASRNVTDETKSLAAQDVMDLQSDGYT